MVTDVARLIIYYVRLAGLLLSYPSHKLFVVKAALVFENMFPHLMLLVR